MRRRNARRVHKNQLRVRSRKNAPDDASSRLGLWGYDRHLRADVRIYERRLANVRLAYNRNKTGFVLSEYRFGVNIIHVLIDYLPNIEFTLEWIDKSYAFNVRTRLKIFAEDHRNLIQAGSCPNLRIPKRELMVPHSARGFEDN